MSDNIILLENTTRHKNHCTRHNLELLQYCHTRSAKTAHIKQYKSNILTGSSFDVTENHVFFFFTLWIIKSECKACDISTSHDDTSFSIPSDYLFNLKRSHTCIDNVLIPSNRLSIFKILFFVLFNFFFKINNRYEH